jgi:micrococcal nuclease
VVRVVDGDTIVARIGTRDEKIRLIGIDTPETVDPRKPVQCYGREASDRMKSLLPPGSPIRIERDVEERDIYRRLLAYVWRGSDDLFVNRAMVADGYAHLLTIPPNVAYTDEFTRAMSNARSSGLGLWRACPHE